MRRPLLIAAILSLSSGIAAQAGDPARGETLWKDCKACHQIGKAAMNRVGPMLNGLLGRPAGTVEGFSYSDAMRAAGEGGLVWTEDSLDSYLENPRGTVDGTRMSYRGMAGAADRADLIAYIATFSTDPASPAAAAAPDVALDPAILGIAGDPEYGEYLASECLTCHQPEGKDDGIPAITGWPTGDFVVALHAYKLKVRRHPVMNMVAGRLSNEEIAALAAYFHRLERRTSN